MWLLLFLLSPVLGLHMKEPPLPESASRNEVPERWLDVKLNHFDASNTDKFPMRYYYNGINTAPTNSNVVIYVGGEWEISPGWVSSGLPYEIASLTGSGLFYTEHRFYGLTRPFRDTSLTNLRFLNVDQALGDLAEFIQHVKSEDFENGRFRNASVGLVGCSYAGTMATWMRVAYPHLVNVAFSDSGPLHAQEDFPEYLEVITEALRNQGGEACVANISEAVTRMTDMLYTTEGAAQISTMFNTCAPLQANATLDSSTFFWYGITETFAVLVQYAMPGDIAKACGVITEATESDPVQRLANWINSMNEGCIESRYSVVVDNHRNTDFDSKDATMRLWTYQTCVEYGWYQTTSSDRQPFLQTVPLEYFHQMCKDFFSNNVNESLLRSGIGRTNLFFGGRTLPDYVVSVTGGIDPWRPMGPNVTHSTPLSPVYFVPDVSHCRTVMPMANSETEEIRDVKLAVIEYMAYHMTGSRTTVASAHVSVVTPIVLLLSVIALIL
ncbi:putative serine protease K12H4.7 [Pieris rapae]|uniref:putative serine protease K12H4.7 n=1 Tax=Pieris rapae TaxID=64459 RepID=UPI001E280652|nr:putative serine protease K12H4.7 [Pieris rapae]